MYGGGLYGSENFSAIQILGFVSHVRQILAKSATFLEQQQHPSPLKNNSGSTYSKMPYPETGTK